MTDLEQQTLHALFRFSRDTRHISASALARALSCTPTRAARALVALERRGLVDATRARLTMLGLATAARLGPAAGGPRLRSEACRPVERVAIERAPLAARADAGERAPAQAPVPGEGQAPAHA